jgi:hypothetical protein
MTRTEIQLKASRAGSLLGKDNLTEEDKDKIGETIFLFQTMLDKFWVDMLDIDNSIIRTGDDGLTCLLKFLRDKSAKNFNEANFFTRVGR